MTTPTADTVARWVDALNGLRFSREDGTEATMRTNQWVGMLCARYPAWAFCGLSLEHVAHSAGRADDYRDVTKALSEWMRANQDRAPRAIPHEAVAHLDDDERQWLSYFRKRIAAGGDREHLSSLIRQEAPRAWQVILQDELESAS